MSARARANTNSVTANYKHVKLLHQIASATAQQWTKVLLALDDTTDIWLFGFNFSIAIHRTTKTKKTKAAALFVSMPLWRWLYCRETALQSVLWNRFEFNSFQVLQDMLIRMGEMRVWKGGQVSAWLGKSPIIWLNGSHKADCNGRLFLLAWLPRT